MECCCLGEVLAACPGAEGGLGLLMDGQSQVWAATVEVGIELQSARCDSTLKRLFSPISWSHLLAWGMNHGPGDIASVPEPRHQPKPFGHYSVYDWHLAGGSQQRSKTQPVVRGTKMDL